MKLDLPYSLHTFDRACWVEKHALSYVSLIVFRHPDGFHSQSVPLGSRSQLCFDIEHPNLTNHGSSAIYDEKIFRKSTRI